jgi:hypothetical protein
MLCILTAFALPPHRMFMLRLVDLIQRIPRDVADGLKGCLQRLGRRFHRFSSSCSCLPVSFLDMRVQRRSKRDLMFIRTYTRLNCCPD